jgi:membrane fusion protein, multidrug efflux system
MVRLVGGQVFRRSSPLAGLAVLLLVLVSCDDSPRITSTASAAAPAIPQATAQAPVTDSRPDFLASGPLIVENQLDVASQREGIVSRLNVDTGRSVRRGELLATIDDRQLHADHDAVEAKLHAIEADVKNWEAEVKVLQADLDRTEKMWDAQLITKEQLDHARFKVEADKFELERERHNLQNQQAVLRSLDFEMQKTQITAPFDGVVARRYVRVGQKIAIGDRLFWVTAIAPLRVKFTLPERFAGHVRVGQLLSVSTSESASGSHPARIIQVSPVVDPASGTIEIMAELCGKPLDLRPGMTAQVHVPDVQSGNAQ